MIETKKFLGLKYSIFNLEELKQNIIFGIKNGITSVYYGYSLTLLSKFKKYPEIYLFSNRFDYFLADGKGYYFFLRLFGIKLESDISLPDLAILLLEIANEKKFSVLLFGADNNTNIAATGKIRRKYPNAKIVDGINGFYNEMEEAAIINKINALSPDIMLVGISSPKKEKISIEWKDRLKVKVIVPCGGVIDVFAENTKREPKIVKKIGLTWIYRFLQEPKRLFKPLFMGGLSVLFWLIPKVIYEIKIKKNTSFSIPEFYHITESDK